MPRCKPTTRATRAAASCAVVAVAAIAAAGLAGCAATGRVGRSPGPRSSTARLSPPPAGTHYGPRVHGAAELIANKRPARVTADAAAPVASAEQAFTVALLQRVQPATSQNVTVSPASLALALSMVENGAAGRTRAEIAQALHVAGVPLAVQNAGWQALVQDWARAAHSGGFSLASANAVWMQHGLPVRPSFLDALTAHYGAGVWQTDFARHMPDSLQAIDAWCAQQTNDKITKLFDSLDPATVLVLADAVYFRAEWQTAFESDLTTDAPFTMPDGRTANVPTMHSAQLTAPSVVTPEYRAVQLPYRGGRFAALAIMPTGPSLASFVGSLTAERLAQITASLRGGAVDVTIPRFTTSSTLDSLPEVLQSLGMRRAFSSAADFSALSPQALSISQIIQRAYLSVTEKGTEAAAVTGIGMTSSAAVQKQVVHLDHPFLFLIRDVKTGAVLFASEIVNPGGE